MNGLDDIHSKALSVKNYKKYRLLTVLENNNEFKFISEILFLQAKQSQRVENVSQESWRAYLSTSVFSSFLYLLEIRTTVDYHRKEVDSVLKVAMCFSWWVDLH